MDMREDDAWQVCVHDTTQKGAMLRSPELAQEHRGIEAGRQPKLHPECHHYGGVTMLLACSILTFGTIIITESSLQSEVSDFL